MYLLDTHILLGLLMQETHRFPPRIRDLLSGPENEFTASVASIWEIAIKNRLAKLELPWNLAMLPTVVRNAGLAVIAISEEHVLADPDPLPATKDPFDRLLLAQCRVDGLRLVTLDRVLADHPLAARV